MKVLLIAIIAVVATGCGDVGRFVDCIDGCSMRQGPQGTQGEVGPQGDAGQDGATGPKGEQGEVGESGQDAAFLAIGSLATYNEVATYEGDAENQLTCMTGDSAAAGKVVLRLRSKSGGILTFRKAGGITELVILPPGLEILIYTQDSSGTYISKVGDSSNSTKACSVPN